MPLQLQAAAGRQVLRIQVEQNVEALSMRTFHLLR